MCRRQLRPCLLLPALGLLFFAPLVRHPTYVLYSDHSDLLAEHLPAKQFLVRSWQETGEMPRWCPYSFAGMPFIHDVQVGAFYPPYWSLLLLPEAGVGAGLSWLIVVHVLLAGCGMYAYASARGLGQAGAFVAAVGWMFAGKWLLHLLLAGHTITIGLAWLPLVLLALETAIRRGDLVRATWAGTAFALLILGTHPQWTFYAGLFVAFWTLATVAADGLTRTVFLRWLGLGLWAAIVAVGLTAVQLLPMLEAAGESNRAAGVAASSGLGEGRLLLFGFFGPYLRGASWEYQGAVSPLWLTAAVLAPLLSWRRVRYQALVGLLLLVFALGGSTFVQGLPGFNLFRQPTRMLIVFGFPLAYLAGETTRALFADPAPQPERLRKCRRPLFAAFWFSLALLAGLLLYLTNRPSFDWPPLAYWLTQPLLMAAALRLLSQPATPQHLSPAILWSMVLLADVWLRSAPLVAVISPSVVYAPSACVRFVTQHNRTQGRVLDRDAPPGTKGLTPLGTGAPLALTEQLEVLRGYNPLDVLRYKEYLQFLGNRDEPLLPFASPLTFPVIGDFPVRNRSLLDLLGVRFVLQPAEEIVRNPLGQPVFTDSAPTAYSFVAGGMQRLPAYVVYENRQAFPRAFVVPQAEPMPERSLVLAALRDNDFRRTVFLEGWQAHSSQEGDGFRSATIREYQPNRVVVEVDGPAPGFLVLTDVWFPGWTCTLDGEPAPLYRANYLFRATPVPAGAHVVVFTFEPGSYRIGQRITGTALVVLFLAGVSGLIRRRLKSF